MLILAGAAGFASLKRRNFRQMHSRLSFRSRTGGLAGTYGPKRRGHRAHRAVAAGAKLGTEGLPEDCDVAIIGAGLGGLACAAALAKTGRRVVVLESHTACGGCAHSFQRRAPGGGQYLFDSGPSILTDMGVRNPLRQVLDYVGASDGIDWIHYDGWGMLTPEGPWKFTLGPKSFRDDILPKYGVPVSEFDAVAKACAPLSKTGRSIPGVVLRDDDWQLLPLLLKFPGAVLPAIKNSPALNEPFSNVLDRLESEGQLRPDSWLRRWLDALAFSISGLDCTGTTTAAMAFTVDEMHDPTSRGLAYPRGGMGAVIDALVEAVERNGGVVRTGVRVSELMLEGRRAVGVRYGRAGAKKVEVGGSELRAAQAVVCNASIWDSAQLLPRDAAAAGEEAELLKGIQEDWTATPMTRSYLHLHVGLDAAGLDLSALLPHYTSMASWDDVTAEQNMVAISNPALLDPLLCPEGKLVLHLYCAGNEPYDIWAEAEATGREAYESLKNERAERLWEALQVIIPDAKDRVEVALIGSPATHRRFLTRASGTYGPAPVFGRFGPGQLPFRTARDAVQGREGGGIEGLLLCGDSTFPGIGVPAAVVSGLSAAHSAMSVWEHLDLLGRAGY